MDGWKMRSDEAKYTNTHFDKYCTLGINPSNKKIFFEIIEFYEPILPMNYISVDLFKRIIHKDLEITLTKMSKLVKMKN